MKKKKRIGLWALLIILLLAVVAYTTTNRTADNVTGHAVQTVGTTETGPNETSNQTGGSPAGAPEDNSTGSGPDDGSDDNGDDGQDDGSDPGDAVDYPPYSACNEYNCESPGVCVDGVCKFPGCMTDEDCIDDDGCTEDKCYFAPHPNAFCSTKVITEYKNNDGCCPKGAHVDDDTDCEPICGDKLCDYGESTRTCAVDCRHAGSRPAPPPPPSPPQET